MNNPLSMLSEAILLNKPIVIFSRNNKKLIGYLKAFDKHMNLALENVRELCSKKTDKNGILYYERFFSKIILRGDTIVLILRE